MPSREGASGRPVAVITGASRGLSFLLVRELGHRGYDLVVCARSEGGLQAVRPELQRSDAEVHC